MIAGPTGTGTTYRIPLVVRTSMPNVTVPTASLFGLRREPAGRYLIETDPRFANYRNWLSSDYLLNSLGQDPNNALKRLGDGFYEQKLIREQLAQLTGYRYLDGYFSDEDQYTALMNAGATFADGYGLRPGIALTPAQMAQLTSDIVWLVEQTVTLPDGTTQKVLAPQVYVRVQPGDITGAGSLLSADRTIIKGAPESPNVGTLNNSGTIAGRTLVSINAESINNLGGRISGGSVVLDATTDIDNIGGTIDANNSLLLKAGRDIRVETTTQGHVGPAASKINIDRVAGLYVSNPGGTLIVIAGNDVNVIGGILSNKGQDSFTSITADKNIKLGTVTELESRLSIFGPTTFRGDASSKEIGSTIAGNGTVLLHAKGGDIDARAATLDAGAGTLSLTAAGDINIMSGEATQSTIDRSQASQKRTLKTIKTTISGDSESTFSIGSRLYGGSIGLFAEGDINVLGSDIEARKNATLKALGTVNIGSSVDSASASVERTRTTKGFLLPKLGGSSIDRKLSMEQHAGVSSQTERASNVTAGRNLNITAGEQANIHASSLSAGEDLTVSGREVNVVSGTNEVSREIGTKTSKQSIGTTGNFKRAGKGMNGKESVVDRLDQTMLARAKLSGTNVTITATDGDLTLGAVQIQAGDKVALNAPKGAVNMDVVKTATEVSQSRGESDPMYQRTRDIGAHVEEANYTLIDSKTLELDTPKLNVQVGQSTVVDKTAAVAAQQTIEQVLEIQRNQPGMGWLKQVQNDPAFSKLQINWQGVPLEQRQWAEKQGSLTEAGGAVVAIVAAVVTWGAASGVGAMAGGAVGGGTTGTIVSAAVSAGVSSIAAQAAVSLINNNGNIGEVLEDLTSSQGIRSIVTAMATAGALQGLSASGFLPDRLALATNGSAKFIDQLGRQLIDRTASAVVRTAINGGSLRDNLKEAIVTAFLNTAGAKAAFEIGEAELNAFSANAAHAIAGCAIGAGRGAIGGSGAPGGCAAGAIGALVGHLGGGLINPTNEPTRMDETIRFSRLMAGISGAIVGGDAASVDIAAQAGEAAVQNNQFGKVLRGVVVFCKLFPAQCIAQADGELAAGALIAERIRQERQRNPALSEDGAEAVVMGDIMARATVNAAVDGYKAISNWFSSTPPPPTGAPGFGAGGVPRMPNDTGHTTPPPKVDSTTGGSQIVDQNPDGNIVGGGYGAGKVPDYSGPLTTPGDPLNFDPLTISQNASNDVNYGVPRGYSQSLDGIVSGPGGGTYRPTEMQDINGNQVYIGTNGNYYTLSATGSVRVESPNPPSGVGETGKIGENSLKQLGGKSQVFFRTSQGLRVVDQLAPGNMANESKVGYTSLDVDTKNQIAKDAELIGSDKVNGVTWHFFKSPTTGRGGASPDLLKALDKAGIKIKIH